MWNPTCKQIKGEAVRNINNFFRIAIYQVDYDEDYKFTLCRYLFILMNKKKCIMRRLNSIRVINRNLMY